VFVFGFDLKLHTNTPVATQQFELKRAMDSHAESSEGHGQAEIVYN